MQCYCKILLNWLPQESPLLLQSHFCIAEGVALQVGGGGTTVPLIRTVESVCSFHFLFLQLQQWHCYVWSDQQQCLCVEKLADSVEFCEGFYNCLFFVVSDINQTGLHYPWSNGVYVFVSLNWRNEIIWSAMARITCIYMKICL